MVMLGWCTISQKWREEKNSILKGHFISITFNRMLHLLITYVLLSWLIKLIIITSTINHTITTEMLFSTLLIMQAADNEWSIYSTHKQSFCLYLNTLKRFSLLIICVSNMLHSICILKHSIAKNSLRNFIEYYQINKNQSLQSRESSRIRICSSLTKYTIFPLPILLYTISTSRGERWEAYLNR